MAGCFTFQWEEGGASFLRGGAPWGGINFDGGGEVSKKESKDGEAVPPHAPLHYGKPRYLQ